LSPQITGVAVVAPLTVKVSVQVPTVGWAVVKEIKSNLNGKEIRQKIKTCYLINQITNNKKKD
jgi:hypothetical protein